MARNLDPRKDENKEAVIFVNELLGLDETLGDANKRTVSPRVAVSIAIYRNRTGKEKGNS